MSETSRDNYRPLFFLCYYVFVALNVLGDLFVSKYWFAFSFGSYLPVTSRWILILFAILIPPLVLIFNRRTKSVDSSSIMEGNYEKLATMIIIIAVAVLFYLLRAKGFYLGDGESLLASVASANPIIKTREIGESLVHVWFSRLLGGPNEQSALLSYQILSIVSGLLFLITVFLLSRKLFDCYFERLLFVALWVSGGFSLLFFGYVENYSILAFGVALFSIIGLLVMRGELSRLWILPAYTFALFMHGLALTLTPALLIVLSYRTSVFMRIRSVPRSVQYVAGLFLIIIGVLLFQYLSARSFFFRFAFVPLFENRFTVGHYTLFSLRHITDVINVTVLLVPAIVFVPLFRLQKLKGRVFEASERIYLLILSLSVLSVPFLLDPKLGMPKDWDLFAFAGIPVGLFVSLLIVRSASKRMGMYIVLLAICLNIFFLSGRVLVNHSEESAFEQFYDYYYFDPLLNQNSFFQIIDYYREAGDEMKVIVEQNKWGEINPSWKSNRDGQKALSEGRFRDAVDIFKKTIRQNPASPSGYSNIGAAYLSLGIFDSALVYCLIARGMNPYNPRVNHAYGMLQIRLEHYDEAEKALKMATAIDPSLQEAYQGLMTLYGKTGRIDEYFNALESAVKLGGAPAYSYRRLIEHFLKNNDYQKSQVYMNQLKAFPDQRGYIDTLIMLFPRLQ